MLTKSQALTIVHEFPYNQRDHLFFRMKNLMEYVGFGASEKKLCVDFASSKQIDGETGDIVNDLFFCSFKVIGTNKWSVFSFKTFSGKQQHTKKLMIIISLSKKGILIFMNIEMKPIKRLKKGEDEV